MWSGVSLLHPLLARTHRRLRRPPGHEIWVTSQSAGQNIPGGCRRCTSAPGLVGHGRGTRLGLAKRRTNAAAAAPPIARWGREGRCAQTNTRGLHPQRQYARMRAITKPGHDQNAYETIRVCRQRLVRWDNTVLPNVRILAFPIVFSTVHFLIL